MKNQNSIAFKAFTLILYTAAIVAIIIISFACNSSNSTFKTEQEDYFKQFSAERAF